MANLQTVKDFLNPEMPLFQNTIVSKTKGDKVIWAIIFILTISSLLLVYSSTGSLAYKYSKSNESFLFKQFVFIVLGLLFIFILHRVNYTFYKKVAVYLFLFSIPLLIYTLFFGVQLNGGSRWLRLPIINMTFQSSDFAKLALFMYLSRQLSRKQAVIKDFKKGYLPVILPVLIICGLIAPANLSTALLVGGTSLILIFIGRAKGAHIFGTLLIALIPLVILVTIAMATYNKDQPSQKLTGLLGAGRIPTWISRVQNFIYGGGKEDSDNEKMYQVTQAKIAVAKGGWLGRGPGNSEQRNFLPHSYSDFIYAIILEEYGIIGGIFFCLLYLWFLFRCIRIYKRTPYAFGALLAIALSFSLVIQAVANMGVNVSLFPNTGVTLPLVSMGGSSFLFTCFALGIILSVARYVQVIEGKIAKENVESIIANKQLSDN